MYHSERTAPKRFLFRYLYPAIKFSFRNQGLYVQSTSLKFNKDFFTPNVNPDFRPVGHRDLRIGMAKIQILNDRNIRIIFPDHFYYYFLLLITVFRLLLRSILAVKIPSFW